MFISGHFTLLEQGRAHIRHKVNAIKRLPILIEDHTSNYPMEDWISLVSSKYILFPRKYVIRLLPEEA